MTDKDAKIHPPIMHLFDLVNGNFFEKIDVEYVILQMVVSLIYRF